jgi:type VI secretion system secreted protein Hcp
MADNFLKIEEIKGESQDDKHRDEIEIHSWSFDEANSESLSSESGGNAGKVVMQDFKFVAPVSKASPLIFFAVASGQHFPEAILTVRKSGGDQVDFLKWTLSDIFFSSWGEARQDDGTRPLDSFSINFAKIEMEYKVQNPDGSLGAAVRRGWDVKQAKAF